LTEHLNRIAGEIESGTATPEDLSELASLLQQAEEDINKGDAKGDLIGVYGDALSALVRRRIKDKDWAQAESSLNSLINKVPSRVAAVISTIIETLRNLENLNESDKIGAFTEGCSLLFNIGKAGGLNNVLDAVQTQLTGLAEDIPSIFESNSGRAIAFHSISQCLIIYKALHDAAATYYQAVTQPGELPNIPMISGRLLGELEELALSEESSLATAQVNGALGIIYLRQNSLEEASQRLLSALNVLANLDSPVSEEKGETVVQRSTLLPMMPTLAEAYLNSNEDGEGLLDAVSTIKELFIHNEQVLRICLETVAKIEGTAQGNLQVRAYLLRANLELLAGNDENASKALQALFPLKDVIGQWSSLASEFEQLVEALPESADKLLLKADQLAIQGDVSSAIELYIQATKEREGWELPEERLAQLRDTGNVDSTVYHALSLLSQDRVEATTGELRNLLDFGGMEREDLIFADIANKVSALLFNWFEQAMFGSVPEEPSIFPDITPEWVSINQSKEPQADVPWTQQYVYAVMPLWRQGPEGEITFQAGDVGPVAKQLAQWVVQVSGPLEALLPIAFRTLMLLSTTEEERKALLKAAKESLNECSFDRPASLQMALCISDLFASLSSYADAVIALTSFAGQGESLTRKALHTAEMDNETLKRLDALGALISEKKEENILTSVSEEQTQPLSDILGDYLRVRRHASVSEVDINACVALLDVILTISPSAATEYMQKLDLPAWNPTVAEYALAIAVPEELNAPWEKIRFRAADILGKVEETIEFAKAYLRAGLPLESLLEKHTDAGKTMAHLAYAETLIEAGNVSAPELLESLTIASAIDELLGEDLTTALRQRTYQALMAVIDEDTGVCAVEARVLAGRYAADNSGWFNALRDILFDHGTPQAERIGQLVRERLPATEATLLLGASLVLENRCGEAYRLGDTLATIKPRANFDRFMEDIYVLAAEKGWHANLPPESLLYRHLHQIREGGDLGRVGLNGVLSLFDTTPDLSPIADGALTSTEGWENNPWATLALAVIRDGDIELLERTVNLSDQADILEEIVAFAHSKFLPKEGEPVETKHLLANAVIGSALSTLGGRQNLEKALEHFAKIDFLHSKEDAKIQSMECENSVFALAAKCKDEGELDLAGEAYLLLGQAYAASEKPVDAATAMDEALNLYPEPSLARRIEPLAQELIAQQPDEPTIVQLRRRIAKTLEDDEALLQLCESLIELKRPEGIADELESVATKHDGEPAFAGRAYLTAGFACILEVEDERAVLLFERTLDKDENLQQRITDSLIETTSGESPRVILLEFLARLQETSPDFAPDYIETYARYVALIKDSDVDKALEIAHKTLSLAEERGDDVLPMAKILNGMLVGHPDNSAIAHAVVHGKGAMLDRTTAIASMRPLLLEIAQGEVVDILADGLVELNPEPATEKMNAQTAGIIILDKKMPHLEAKAGGLLLPSIDDMDKSKDEQAPDVAKRLLESLGELETTTPDKHLDLLETEALAYSILDNPERASELFRAALARLGEPMYSPERWQDLHERLERTLEQFPESPGIQFVLAESYITQDIKPEKSVDVLEASHRTIRPDVKEPAAEHPAFKVLELYEYLGGKLLQLERYVRAIDIYRLAIAENPDSRGLRELLWNAKKLFIEQLQSNLGNTEEEDIPGEKQISIGSWHVEFGFPFGVQNALSWFARASKKASTREAGMIGQARCLLALGAPGPALKTLEQIDENIVGQKSRAALLELMGRAHEGLGHYGKAAEYFSLLLAENPEHPDFAALHRKMDELQSQTELIWAEPQSLLPELSLMDLFEDDENT